MMWIVDLLLVLPSFLLIAVLSPLYRGKTWLVFVVLLAAFGWMITSRIVRGMAMSLRERDFVRAARYMGVPTRTIVFRHLIPNVASILIIAATLDVGGTILSETGLSYLGFGINPPEASLGNMLTKAQDYFYRAPLQAWYPGVTLVLVVLAASFLGDGLRDALDPRQRVESN